MMRSDEETLRVICHSIGIQSIRSDDGLIPCFEEKHKRIQIGQSFCIPTKYNKRLVAKLDGSQFSVQVGSPDVSYFTLFKSDINDPNGLPSFADIKGIVLQMFKTDQSIMMIDVGSRRFQMANGGLKVSRWDNLLKGYSDDHE